MATRSQPDPMLLKVGGYSGLLFAAVWGICASGYLWLVGIPSSPPGLLEMAELMRKSSYKLLFWLWPIAWLAMIPFTLAAAAFRAEEAPVSSRLAAGFLHMNVILWFVNHAIIMAAISVAQSEPLKEDDLALLLSLVGTMTSPLFASAVLWGSLWGVALRGTRGVTRLACAAFWLIALTTAIYFVLRHTGPFRVAEVIHELMILAMIVSVGGLGSAMAAGSKKSSSI